MGKKILIVCYSNTGNTLRIASVIQKVTGGELCKIYPWQPYPPRYQELVRQVRQELHDAYRPRLLPLTVRPEKYDVIFAGTPNWGGTMAPPLVAFLTKFDLAGKTVIPFCSHGGGGGSRVTGDIKELCPRAEVMPGFHVIGDGGVRLERILCEWMEAIGLKETLYEKEGA